LNCFYSTNLRSKFLLKSTILLWKVCIFGDKKMIIVQELQDSELIYLTEEELLQSKGGIWANVAGAAVGGLSAGASAAITSPGNLGTITGATVSGALFGFIAPVTSIQSASSAALFGIANGMVSGTVGNLVDMYNGKK
jgi:hypothetical protein